MYLTALILLFLASTGVHTQRIESSWNVAKKWYRHSTAPRTQFAEKMCEYLWRRWLKKNNLDPFEALLSALRLFYGDLRITE